MASGRGIRMQKKLNAFEFIHGKPFLSLIIGGVVYIIGILFSDIPTMIVSQGWPMTGGIITTHQFMGQKFKEYDGDFYINVDVYIHYQYSVNNISYSSRSINSIDTPFYPKSFASRYPIGKDVTVYYNPKDPSEAVLEPGFVDVFKAFDVFSFLIFGVGTYYIFLGISGIKKQKSSEID